MLSLARSKLHTHNIRVGRTDFHPVIIHVSPSLVIHLFIMSTNESPTTTESFKTTTKISKTKPKIKWSSKYNEDDADIELISSDGWHFKVHSYRLQTFS
jgi:hypothetical protein